MQTDAFWRCIGDDIDRVRKLGILKLLLGYLGDLYLQIPLGEYDPPALPTMAPKVWQSAFVHNSKYPAQHRRRLNYENPTNEGLEFLGDALLYVTGTAMVQLAWKNQDLVMRHPPDTCLNSFAGILSSQTICTRTTLPYASAI